MPFGACGRKKKNKNHSTKKKYSKTYVSTISNVQLKRKLQEIEVYWHHILTSSVWAYPPQIIVFFLQYQK